MSGTILYDLPSKGRTACWSLNPWKTRAALNFKGVDYKTEWVEYPNIAPTLKAKGIAPSDPPLTSYTIPAIRFEDGEYVMKSENIIGGIERRYPSPSLHIDSPLYPEALDTVQACSKARPDIIPRVCYNLLDPPSQEYFERTRAAQFRVSSLRDLMNDEVSEKAWKDAEPGFQKAIELLKKNPEGPYFMGNTPSYADIVFASFVHWLKRSDHSLFEKAMAPDPVLKAHYDACAQWFERDD